ncbi:MAG: hypothetical protein HY904_14250 [Deltaproteobacteria bacterium]|nr:hypothetical protein [Deltaproteobacteria bacterium]
MLPLLVACAAGEGESAADVRARPHAVELAQRPDTQGSAEQFTYDTGDLVESYAPDGGRFRVHYTRTGRHAVTPVPADGGVPPYVVNVADLYERVADFYANDLGFRRPLEDSAVTDGNGGDGRFDVYLLDFAFSADGAFKLDACTTANPDICIGYMVQENDFAGYGYPSVNYANRVLSSHEFFHAVQAAYDEGQGSVLSEATAVWATEKFDSSLMDFEGFLDGFLLNPDHSLDQPLPGPVDPFSYGAALFFQFLDEKYGPSVIRELWESVENGHGGVADPQWLDQMDGVLAPHSATFAEAFAEFAAWNLQTGRFDDPLHAYAHGGAYPEVALTEVAPPHENPAIRVFYASARYYSVAPDGRPQMTVAVVNTPLYPDATQGLRLVLTTRTVNNQALVSIVDPAVDAIPVVDTATIGALVVGVVNTATSGSSRRPGLCIGSPDEVDACRMRLSGQTPDAGSGEPDAGTPPDAGSSGSGGDSGGDDDGGGGGPFGCSAGDAPRGTPWPAVCALLLLASRRRTRAR